MAMDENELKQMSVFFRSLGATESQAATMAAQLLKRAEQIASERGVPRLEAVDYLLKVAIAGREGRVYEGPIPGNGSTKRDEA